MTEWEARRLTCTEKHFDTYFRLSISDQVLSVHDLTEIIEKSGNVNFVKERFLDASTTIRKNGKSLVPLLFDELNVYASRIDLENVRPFLSAIFEIADDIDREEDQERGFHRYGDHHLRIHWLIRRLTFERCDLEYRSEILIAACQNAQVAWLVDFASSAHADYFPREEREPEPSEKCLVARGALDELIGLAISSIETTAENGTLITNNRLLHIIFRWFAFTDDDGTSVKAWTNEQLGDDVSVAILAKAFTGESWSQGMGMVGLGDRVSMRHARAQVDGLGKLVDVQEFRARLEELDTAGSLASPYREDITTFRQVWRKEETDRED